MKEYFSYKIKRCDIKKITQEQLAQLTNVNINAATDWEQNKSYPNFDILQKISKIFEVSIDELFDEKELGKIKQWVIRKNNLKK